MIRVQILLAIIALKVLAQNVETTETSQKEMCQPKITWRTLMEDLQTRICSIKSKEIEVKSSKIEKAKNPSKKADKYSKLQRLFRWMNKMKTMWIDFPVFETSDKTTSNKMTSEKKTSTESWLSSCQIDKVTLDEGNLMQLLQPSSLVLNQNVQNSIYSSKLLNPR
jgi:hypothetical protein